MARQIALAHLTAVHLNPAELVTIAGGAGYSAVGFKILPSAPGGPEFPLMDDRAMLADTLAAMDGEGVSVNEIEIIRLGEDFDPTIYTAFLEVGAKLGARSVIVAGDDENFDRLVQSFGRLCEVVEPYGMSVDIEFMPWKAIDTGKKALALLEAAGQPNGGILVDPLHVSRSGTTIADLAAIPHSMINYYQICDASAQMPRDLEEMLYVARKERMLPGQGGIDLRGMVDVLPDDVVVSVEIPSEINRAAGDAAWVSRCLHATRAFLQQA